MKLVTNQDGIWEGEEDYSDWTDDDLCRGYRSPRSTKLPARIPRAIHDELVRRKLSKAYDLLRDSLVDAVRVLIEIVQSPAASEADRIRAATLIMDRVMGKAPEQINVSVEQEPPWAVAIRDMYASQGSLKVGPGDDVIDAEVVEDEDIIFE